jgi:cell division protein FtsQ
MKLPAHGKAILLLALLGAGAAAATVGANSWKTGLRVAEVTVEGTRVLSQEEVLRLAGVKKGEALFAVDLFAVRNRVRANLFVRDVAVKRDAPDRVVIRVTERVPAALLTGGSPLTIDAEGMVLPGARPTALFDLPVISVVPGTVPLAPGKRADHPALMEALEILATAERLGDEAYRRISDVRVDGERDIVLTTAESGVPVVFGRGDVARKMVVFESFWKEVVRPVGAFALHYVDLRYHDQVVVRWKQQPPAPGDSLRAQSMPPQTTPAKEQPWTISS